MIYTNSLGISLGTKYTYGQGKHIGLGRCVFKSVIQDVLESRNIIQM